MVEEIIAKVRLDNGQLQADVQSAKKIVDSGITEIEKNPIKLGADFSKIDAELKKIGNNAPALKSMLENLKTQLAAATDKKTFDELSTSIRLTESALVKLTGETVKLDAVTQKYTDRLNVVNTKIKEWQKAGLDNTAGFSKLLREQELLTKKLGDTTTTSFAKSEERVVSLKTQMRLAQQEVAELSIKFGATSVQAIEAAKRASELKDAIGDARDLTDAFNPDAKFAALSGSIQGVVGGFTAVQGAIGAFGVKSEEVEQALLKVNSAMALSQGLQSVGSSVDSFKQLGAVIKSSTTFQFLYNAATSTATAVQSAFGVATAATTTGFKLLRGAIISTGIGALVVGLGMVIANFDAISAWISKSPLGAFANQIGSIVEKFTDFIGVTSEAERASDRLAKANKSANKAIENRIKLLKAQGGSEKEIATLQKQAIQNDINVLNSKKKLSDEEKQTREDLKNDLLVVDAEYNSKVAEDNKKANEKAADARKKAAEDEKKDRDKSNEMLNTLRNNNTLDAIKDSEQRALKQLEIEDKRQRDEIALLKISNEQKIALYKELDTKLEQGRADIITKQREKNYEAELKKVEDNFNKEESILKEQLANNVITETEYNNKITDLQLSELEAKQFVATNWSSYVKKAAEDATIFEEQSNDKRLDNLIKNNAAKKEEQSKAYENELKLADDLFKQESLALKAKLANGQISEEEYNQKIKDLESSTLQSKISIATKWSGTVKKAEQDITTFTNEEADKRLDKQIDNNKRNEELLKKALGDLATMASQGVLVRLGINPQDADRLTKSLTDIYQKIKEGKPIDAGEIADTAGSAYFAVSNAIAASDTQRRQEELAALQAQQEEELRLAGDNEQKKDLIRQKYALKEKDIKRKQAEADKRKAIMDATINTAVAVIKAISQSPLTLGMPWAAIVAALGAAQIALIAATPIPKFAKGGAVPSSDIQGMINGRPHASGGVLIEAEGNEFLVKKSQAIKPDNRALLEAVNMSDQEKQDYINRHYVMPALQAKESQAANNYRHSVIEAENNLIARVSSSTLKSIDRRLVDTNNSIKGLAKKDYSW
jgi:uncharacterized membrane protein